MAESLALLGEMRGAHEQLGVTTDGAAVSACGSNSRWQEVLELLDDMCRDRVQANNSTYNAAMSSCERANGGRGPWSCWTII